MTDNLINSIPQLLHSNATKMPDATAILAPDRTGITYACLYEFVSQVTRQLNAIGIQRHDRVAIVLPNGSDMAVAFLAVSSRAITAPLNPAFGVSEFDFYLADLDAKALIVSTLEDSPARQAALERGIPVLELTSGDKAGMFCLTGEEDQVIRQIDVAQADDVALILHTSGTTSRPKMVPLTHGNLCSSAVSISSILQLTQQDCCLNIMPLFHIHGLIAAVLAPLIKMGSLVCSPGFDADQFFVWLEKFEPSWYTAVPTMHQAILSGSGNYSATIASHPLRFIRSSSASLPPKVMTDLEQVFKAPVIEAYGMTEASHQMTSNPLSDQPRKLGSVGIPAGPEVAIMEEEGDGLRRTGETGEIVIRGSNVTLGYDHNPEANQAAFTGGWFRTGDQGYFDEDGYLFITGRLKEMINRGGEKVTPREVDEALLEHPSVSQVVTFAIAHETLGEDVVAAVILQEGAAATEIELRQYAFNHLADFKVPSQIILVDEIPKGATGKLQRIGLAEKLATQLKEEFIPSSNDNEQTIIEIIQEILGCEPIGITTNFFLAGGDSLKGTQVVNSLNHHFGIDLPVTALFYFPTVAELAKEIDRLFAEVIELEDLAAQLEQLPAEEIERLLSEVSKKP